MHEKVPGWAQALGALIVAGLCASIALVGAGGWPWFAGLLTKSAEGAAAWVQAIGSIAAILWAVWIATAENRRRAEDAIAAAQISSLAVLRLLQHMRAVAEAVAEALEPLAKFDGAPEGLLSVQNTLEVVRLPNPAQVLALVPVGGGCAKSLAHSIATIELLRDSLRVVVTKAQHHDRAVRMEVARIGHGDMTDVAKRLSRCQQQLVDFNNLHGAP
jgi:hypothetical protein